jgi:hypothetical protein
LVERVARAIWEVTHPNPPAWCAWGDRTVWGPSAHERHYTVDQARAAIATTRRAVLEEALQALRRNEAGWREADEMGYRAAGDAVALVEELLKR